MGWKDEAKVVTANDRLLAKIESNKQKAIRAQEDLINKCEKDDLKTKYGVDGDKLDSNTKKDIKDLIIALQADIDNPSEDDNYEPVTVV